MSANHGLETLYLVDAFSLIFQVFHALPEMTSPSGLPTNALFGFTKDMIYLRKERHPTYLVCCFDVSGPTFREEIFKEYKANRGEMPNDLQLQVPLIRKMLEGMRIPILGLQGFEADDLLATLAVAGAARGIDVFICSGDKDCRQLLGDRVKIFNLRKQTVFDADSLKEDWGVRPDQVIDYQTLVGDSVDNVPGVVGVGPKTASKYLQEYGNVDNLIAHMNDLKGKKKENLQTFLPQLEISRTLVTLNTHVPITLDWESWRLQAWDGAKLLELFNSWGFRGFAEQARASLAPAKKKQVVQGSLFGDDNGETSPASIDAVEWPHEYRLVNNETDFKEFMTLLAKQTRFAVDLETTSLTPYQAQIVGLAFSWKEAEAWYLAVRGPANEPLLDPASTLAQLKPILEDKAVGKVNQNILYDWLVFQWNGIHLAGIVGDSMLAHYLMNAGESNGIDALSEKYFKHRKIPTNALLGKGKKQITMDQVPSAQVAAYAGEDADVAWRLCNMLEPMLEERGFKRPESEAQARYSEKCYLYDDIEVPLIEVLGMLEYHGIRLDVPLLSRMSKEMEESLAQLEKDIFKLAGCEFNINSVPQLREILFKQMGFKAIKKTDIGGEASTDQETLEALTTQSHPQVELPRKLLEHRKISKLKGTYADALPALVNPRTGRVHASFNQTITSTGRLSSSDPNLQNIPIRSEMGGQIRRAFLPEQDWLLLTADYSQVELRLLAHFTGDKALQQAFAENRDIHTLVAAQIFGVEHGQVTEAMRRMAKSVNFGVLYGMSAQGLAQRLSISVADATTFIDAYFQKYPRVLEYQQTVLQTCREKHFVETILGRRRQIEGVRQITTYKNRNQPEREAINMQIQGSAADLIKVAMLNIHQRLHREQRLARMLLQIHDELVFEPEKGPEKVSGPNKTNFDFVTLGNDGGALHTNLSELMPPESKEQ